jgi:hypothetical protein
MKLPTPMLPLRDIPWDGIARPKRSHCPICGGHWAPWRGSVLPCHARCLYDEDGRLELVRIYQSGAFRTQADMAKAMGVTTSVLIALLAP